MPLRRASFENLLATAMLSTSTSSSSTTPTTLATATAMALAMSALSVAHGDGLDDLLTRCDVPGKILAEKRATGGRMPLSR